ncbi:uroporphyrinogen-III synthase [Marinospirillum perlucidum]|uniref:uroporphyrinogen-III synthase n=1 Tax=Marinospirillum perlucidum TaxID=1982602 RepID=UPI000DF3D7BB|nr:uroporphyrinogen-III synthase [Marinospirillum perlucidum]
MQKQPLAGLNILTTRPDKLAGRLVGPLQSAGAEVSNIPLLAIEPLELAPRQRQALLDLDQFQKVVVISPSAADQLLQRLDDYWPQWPVGVEWFSVGAGTARQLEKEGLQVNYPETGDKSEDLLLLPQLQDLDQKKLLLVKGAGGRPLLYDTLVSRGARVEVLELYQRVKPRLNRQQLDDLNHGPQQILVISSGEALQQYIELTQGGRKSVHLVLPSFRLEKMAREAGFDRVINSQGAGAEAVIQALSKKFADAC